MDIIILNNMLMEHIKIQLLDIQIIAVEEEGEE
jgi:hypothetical protein